MKTHFSVADLSPQLLSEVKELEKRLRSESSENIILIAYSEEAGSTNALVGDLDKLSGQND